MLPVANKSLCITVHSSILKPNIIPFDDNVFAQDTQYFIANYMWKAPLKCDIVWN